MAESDFPLCYEIELIESTGMVGKARHPILICRAAGMFKFGTVVPDGNIVVLHDDKHGWKIISGSIMNSLRKCRLEGVKDSNNIVVRILEYIAEQPEIYALVA
jgi:hypothetical protein